VTSLPHIKTRPRITSSLCPAPYDLTDFEKRDLIQIIDAGKALPENCRFLLFADKREVELLR